VILYPYNYVIKLVNFAANKMTFLPNPDIHKYWNAHTNNVFTTLILARSHHHSVNNENSGVLFGAL